MDSDFKEQLVLKPVGEEHLAQYDELLSYVFQVTESDIENSGYENKREMVRAKKPVLEQSKVFGWFHGDNLISQIAIYPCEVNIHGRYWCWNLSRICQSWLDEGFNQKGFSPNA